MRPVRGILAVDNSRHAPDWAIGQEYTALWRRADDVRGTITARTLVVHGDDGTFHAFANRCRHMGRRLDPVPGTETVQCCSVIFGISGGADALPLGLETGSLLLIFSLLFALILRGVSFEFRGKVEDPRWRKLWDTCIFIGSFAPALLFGVAFANIFQGLPIDGQGLFHGSLASLLNPYGLLGGVLFVLLFLMHGALWLLIKVDGALHARVYTVANVIWPLLVIVAVAFLVASKFATPLYNNYFAYPALFAIIVAFAFALSPIPSICSGVAPINLMLCS